MQRVFKLFIILFSVPLLSFANGDTTNIPIGRQVFHEKIKLQQVRADKADGHLDGMVKVGPNTEVNLQVTDAMMRKVNALRNDIEINPDLPTNNDKVRYLRYLEYVVRDFIDSWRAHSFTPSLAPLLVDNFEEILKANIRGQSMVPIIQKTPYEVGKINANIFSDNPGFKESRILLFRKFCVLNPDKILANIAPYVD